MPGLLRGIAKTAVVAGTATHVSNKVSRRQARKWNAQDQEQADSAQADNNAPQDESEDTDNQLHQLQELGELRDKGVLTEGEFTAKKQQILGL